MMNKYQYVYQYIKPAQLKEDWQLLIKEINALTKVEISSVEELEKHLDKLNEFDILILEMEARFYIGSMQNSKDEKIQEDYKNFENTVLKIFTRERKLVDSKIMHSAFFDALIQEKPIFKVLQESFKDEKKPLTEEDENVDAQIAAQVNAYNKHLADMTLEVDGKNLPTIMVLLTKMKGANSAERKELYEKVLEKEREFTAIFDKNYDQQIKLRTKKARAFGFSNYRDYNWWEKKCTQYEPKDIEHFCNSIRDIFIPIQVQFTEMRKAKLGVNKLMPSDYFVDTFSKAPLHFFSNIKELKEKVGKVFSHIHPDFQKYFSLLADSNHLDFELRDHKSPGMFSYYLPETGVPFVYLIAMNNAQGISIVFHEVTHAIHNLYTSDKSKLWLKHPNTEASELFTLTMELISMEYWQEFLASERDLLIARMNKLEDCLKLFRMVGLWDRFQTWAYLHPEHNHEERNAHWLFLLQEFNIGIEAVKGSETSWQNRPLIFRHPFYMIEYGIATLGALSIYKNYRIDKDKTINQLISAMKLGNTKPLRGIYKTAGVDFDFTKEKVQETGDFLKQEIDLLYTRIKELD